MGLTPLKWCDSSLPTGSWEVLAFAVLSWGIRETAPAPAEREISILQYKAAIWLEQLVFRQMM